jgi:hypothetical protein
MKHESVREQGAVRNAKISTNQIDEDIRYPLKRQRLYCLEISKITPSMGFERTKRSIGSSRCLRQVILSILDTSRRALSEDTAS